MPPRSRATSSTSSSAPTVGAWLATAPRERGLILGVADARTDRRDVVPVSVWAARYGASMGARGLDRIGLAPSAGLEERSPAVARVKLRRLAEAAAMASLEGDALREALPKRARSRGKRPTVEAPIACARARCRHRGLSDEPHVLALVLSLPLWLPAPHRSRSGAGSPSAAAWATRSSCSSSADGPAESAG